MKISHCLILVPFVFSAAHADWPPSPVVDTGQNVCYDTLEPIRPPREGRDFYGQDAQYQGVQPSYQDNGDGTVTDQVTGLTWSQGVNAEKLNLEEALAAAEALTLGGHND